MKTVSQKLRGKMLGNAKIDIFKILMKVKQFGTADSLNIQQEYFHWIAIYTFYTSLQAQNLA